MSDNRSDNPVPTDANAIPEKSSRKSRYTMANLLAVSDYSQPQPADEREWVDAPSIGRELV